MPVLRRRLPVAGLLFLLVSLPLAAQNSGAIYTTTKSGTVVNGNLFNKADDVHLRGGAGSNQPCSAPGLPDGNYYFQVTDPSGQVLLSSDAITEREVVVQGGVITAHVTGSHKTWNAPCNSKVVRLSPFLATPNTGGEYKVWLTPVGSYDPLGSGFFGFRANHSKTDNFKVRSGGGPPVSQCVITGYKFFDHSQDGVWNPAIDPLEVPIPGWRIEIWVGGVFQDVTFTDIDGRYTFIRPLSTTASYTIVEEAPGGFVGDNIPGAIWIAVTPRSGTVVPIAASVAGPSFGNVSLEVKPGVGRTKGFWHNDNGRLLLAGCDPEWRHDLYVREGVPIGLRTNISSADPLLSLFIPPFPAPGAPTPPFFLLDFMSAHDQLANWLVGDPALGHAGFILSTQVAAAILNSSCGYMQFDAYIDRFQDGILVSFDDMIGGVSGLLTAEGAGLTGPQDPAQYQHLRDMMLMCLNEFGTINNTGDLSEPQVVYGKTELPKTFLSPYEKTQLP
jgi:hypothetical protein